MISKKLNFYKHLNILVDLDIALSFRKSFCFRDSVYSNLQVSIKEISLNLISALEDDLVIKYDKEV